MTSNAGAQRILSPKTLGFSAANDENASYETMKNNVMEEVRHIFKPEFLNRIDETIVFHTLTKDNLCEIVRVLLSAIATRTKEQMGIVLSVTEEAYQLLAEAGFDQNYGARPLKRSIQSKVEDKLAEEILEGKVQAGDTVTVDAKEGAIIFQK